MLERVKRYFRAKARDRTSERRTVALGDPQLRKQHPSNAVRSSKYNALTFIPANLWEQFHRPINLYFLLVATLQFIPSIAPVSPYTTIFPITVAFLINTVKEAIDDIRRHRQDRENNSRRHTRLDLATRQWTEVRSEDIYVGDVLLLRPFEVVPSDVVVLMTSGEGGEAYISTESLDGETGTKERLAVLRDLYDPVLMAAAPNHRSIDTSVTAAARTPDRNSSSSTGTRASQAYVHPPPAAHELSEAIDFLWSASVVVNSEGPNPYLHTYNATVTVTTNTVDGPAAPAHSRRRSGAAEHAARTGKVEPPPRRRRPPQGLPRTSSSVNSFSSNDEREGLLSSSAHGRRGEVGGPERTARCPEDDTRARAQKSLGVTVDNVILASSLTRNTRFVLALVVFTGMETKVAMTRGAPPTKWANIDHTFNHTTAALFLFQFGLLVVYSCLSIAALHSHAFWYLGGRRTRIPRHEYVPILPLRYFTMLSPMVPLSFKVMVEISKAYVSSVIRWDEHLSDKGGDGTGENATVNNSALAEDLGQIEYVLSDKTGTLTTNTMTLAALATSNGTIYACSDDRVVSLQCRHAAELAELTEAEAAAPAAASLRALLAGMTFCNTIERSLLAGAVRPPQSKRDARKRLRKRVAAPTPEKTWMSCSPDEVALVEGVEVCGVTLLERTRKHSRARFWDSLETVAIVKVLPFTSERGRMGVLIRHLSEGENASLSDVATSSPASHGEGADYVLLMKGADEKLLPLCGEAAAGAREHQPATVLEGFSQRGLRTLVYAYRHVPASEAASWLTMVERAEAAITAEERVLRVREAYAAMERDMIYCGCTAVEDQLQEQVDLTISQMRNANIRVWMLTGDKAETARQTAVASGLLTPQDRVFALSRGEKNSTGTDGCPTPGATRQQQLDYTRFMVQRLLNEERTLQHATADEGATSAWQRFYRGSGLRDYAMEFLSPLSYESLKPLNHPLRYHNPDPQIYPPELVERLTTKSASTSLPGLHTASSAAATAAAVRDDSGRGYSLLLAGSTIETVFACSDRQLHQDLTRVLLEANTVICSRTAPDQKAKIVDVIKAAGKVTLSVGDGGNDVAMIQAAHVGVGIKGKEGNQAALSSDFAIGQFRFLARLLLVHGHIAYQRTAVIVQQSFWKSVLIAWVQLLFNIFTDFSGISYWDSFCLVLYNAIPTVPVTFLCVMDVPLSPWMLVRNPQLYRMSQRGRYLSSATFYGYIARAILHGTVVFFLAVGIYHGSGGLLRTSGWVMDRSGDFYAAYFAVVTIHTYTVLTESHSINFAHWQCFLFSVWSCFLCFWLFAASPLTSNPTFSVLLADPHFYLSYIIITTVVCFSQALFATVKAFWFPDVLQLQRTAALCARSPVSGPLSALLAALFEDDNPSQFWRSWSPLHAWVRFGQPTNSLMAVAESDGVPSHPDSLLSPVTI